MRRRVCCTAQSAALQKSKTRKMAEQVEAARCRMARQAVRTASGLTLAVAAWMAGPTAQAQGVAPTASAGPNATVAKVGTVTTVPSAELPITAERLRPGERLPLSARLDHPAWQRAPVYRQFVEKFPTSGAVPAHPTEVRVLYDDEAIYVAVRSEDPAPERIRGPLVRYDGVNRTQDFVVVYLDPIGARQSAQFFRVNAAGSMADGMHTAADDSEDFAPDFDWDATTHRDDRGWTALLKLPFVSLRFASGDQGPWRIMVGRRVPREQFHLHTSVLVPRDAPSFIATLQPLAGVRAPTDHGFFTLRPSLTWRRSSESTSPGPTLRETRFEGSLDLKWRPLPELVVDATLNPDFSQVALDVPQLHGNTRFALGLEEKRPFFFESSDLLRSPTEAIYTRSITEPRWGLRATWRSARLAGTAFTVDDRGGGLVLLPGAYGTGAVLQPASRSAVVRARGDAGALQWGALAATRDYGAAGHNQVAGPDLAWQIDGAWRLRTQLLGSHSTAQPQAGGQLGNGPATRGHRAYARLFYQSPTLETDLWLDDLSEGFRDDLGFVAQNGVRTTGGRIGRGWHQLGLFNELWANLEGSVVRERDTGRAVSMDWHPSLWFTGPHNLEGALHWHGHGRQRLAPGEPLLRERYWRGSVTFTPAAWVPFVTLDAKWGRLADVVAGTPRPGGQLGLSLTTRPLPALDLEPRYSVQWLRDDGAQRYREAAHQVVARWHFNAQHSLRAIVQYTAHERAAEAATVRRPAVSAVDEQGTVGSLTWAWRQSSGTVFYLGAARQRHQAGTLDRGNEVFAKLQVDLDEARGRLGW